MARKKDNKTSLQQLVVGYTDVALASGSHVNSTNVRGISDGQLGIFNADVDSATYGQYLVAGNTVADSNEVKVFQGTPLSNQTQRVNAFQVGHEAQKGSKGSIRAGNIRSVATLQCNLGTRSAEHFTGFTTPLNDSEYLLRLDLESVRNDKEYGDNDETLHQTFVTPNYTNTPLITNPISHLLQNILVPLNYYSKLSNTPQGGNISGNRNLLAFGINRSGGAGQALGTIAEGTLINVMTDLGSTLVYVADKTFVSTVSTWIANGIPATATIEEMNRDTAGLAAGVVVDELAIIGLDEELALAFDNVMAVRTRVNVSLGVAFLNQTTIVKEVISNSVESTGSGRDWTIDYDGAGRLLVHDMQNHPHGEYFIEGETYIDKNKNYTSTIIEHYKEDPTLTTNKQQPLDTTILLECEISNPTANAATGYTYSTVATSVVTSLNLIFTPWLASEKVISNHKLKGQATVGAYFV